MAAKKKGGKKRGAHKRGNPSKKGGHRRRRRNPAEGFGDRAMKLAGGTLAALGAGTLVLIGISKIQPGQPISTYGIPALGFVAGAAIAKSHPMLGGGIALGSVAAPFTLPIASKLLATMQPASSTTTTMTTPASTAAATTQGIATAYRRRMMGMGAVHMGAVHMGRSRAYA